MSTNTQHSPSKKPAIHQELQGFIEDAIADTKELTPEQAQIIREKVQPWLLIYGDRLSWFSFKKLPDTEEVRWNHEYFRLQLREFLAGSINLECIYYAVEMVMIGFLNEKIRLGREQRISEEQEERDQLNPGTEETDACLTFVTDEQDNSVPQPAMYNQMLKPKRTQYPPRSEESQKPDMAEAAQQQFGLFG
jgi:hypothetical protein